MREIDVRESSIAVLSAAPVGGEGETQTYVRSRGPLWPGKPLLTNLGQDDTQRLRFICRMLPERILEKPIPNRRNLTRWRS